MRLSASLIAALLSLGFNAWGGEVRVAEDEGKAEPAPALHIAQWLQGGPADVRDGASIYIVEFWTTWCLYCRAAIPHLNEVQSRYGDHGVVIVGVSNEDAETVQAFMQENEMDYVVAIDEDSATFDAYGVSSIPRAFVVDLNGQVAWEGHPGAAAFDATIARLVEEASAEGEGEGEGEGQDPGCFAGPLTPWKSGGAGRPLGDVMVLAFVLAALSVAGKRRAAVQANS